MLHEQGDGACRDDACEVDAEDARLVNAGSVAGDGRVEAYVQTPGGATGYRRLVSIDAAAGKATDGAVVTHDVESMDRFFLSPTSPKSFVEISKLSTAQVPAVRAYRPA